MVILLSQGISNQSYLYYIQPIFSLSYMNNDTHHILHLPTRHDWRQWLSQNFQKQTEAWLVFPRKSSGKERIPYNDAVEEALCFGWIDSTIKTLDPQHTIQRFTPRNPGSNYSQTNKERLKWLAKQKLLHPSIKEKAKEIIHEEFRFPADIISEIQKNEQAWKEYKFLPGGYKRIRIAYIESARNRPDEFKKRLNNFIDKTAQGKLIKGHGGIDKYYGYS